MRFDTIAVRQVASIFGAEPASDTPSPVAHVLGFGEGATRCFRADQESGAPIGCLDGLGIALAVDADADRQPPTAESHAPREWHLRLPGGAADHAAGCQWCWAEAPCIQHNADFTPKNIVRDGLEEALAHVQRHDCRDCFSAYLNERKAVFGLRPAALREMVRRG